MNENHPFVKWWIEKSRWHYNDGDHERSEDWKASLACSEGTLAIEAWNAALDAHPDGDGGISVETPRQTKG